MVAQDLLAALAVDALGPRPKGAVGSSADDVRELDFLIPFLDDEVLREVNVTVCAQLFTISRRDGEVVNALLCARLVRFWLIL